MIFFWLVSEVAVTRDPARGNEASLTNQGSTTRILPEAFAVFCRWVFFSLLHQKKNWPETKPEEGWLALTRLPRGREREGNR